MSDFEMNLKVVTDHLGELGRFQETAANKITGANRETADIAAKIEETHGLVCFATSQAMSEGETAMSVGASLTSVTVIVNAFSNVRPPASVVRTLEPRVLSHQVAA